MRVLLRIPVLLAITASGVACWAAGIHVQTAPLLPGRAAVSTPLTAGRACWFARVPGASFARFVVRQSGTDLYIEVTSPDGGQAERRDGFEYGEEPASVLAGVGGIYRVCAGFSHSSAQAVPITVVFERPRPPRPEDESRRRAEWLETDGRMRLQRAANGDIGLALEESGEAASLWASLGESALQAAALSLAGDALVAKSDYAGAREKFGRAMASCNGGAPQPLCAEAISNDAVAALRMGDIEAARAGYERSLNMWRALPQRYPFQIAAVENGRGVLLRQTGEIQQALDSFLAALPGLRADQRSEAIAMGNIALAYMSLGEYEKAERYLRNSLPLLNAPGKEDTVARGKALLNLGRVLSLQGNFAGAAATLEKAGNLLDSASDLRARADVAANIAQVNYRRGNFAEALEDLDKARAIYGKIGDVRGLSSVYHYTGTSLAALGRNEEAERNFADALRLRVAAKLDDDAAATLLEMARLQRREAQPAEARASLTRALDIGEKMRVRVASPDLRASWAALRQPVYEELIDLIEQGRRERGETSGADEGLEVSERSRSKSLLDILAPRLGNAQVDPDLLARQRQLAAALSYKSLQLAQLPLSDTQTAARTALLGDIDRLDLEYDSLAGTPGGANDGRGVLSDPPRLSSQQIQTLLDSDSTLLEYLVGDRATYLWAVTRDSIECFRLPARQALEATVRPLVELGGDRNRRLASSAAEREYRLAAAEASRVLLGPARKYLAGKRVIFAPDGILHRVPFAALPDPDVPGGAPMGIGRQILSVPSASAIVVMRQRSRPAAGPVTVTVFADPVFHGDSRSAASGDRAVQPAGSALARLPFSLREALYIRESARTETVTERLGFDARKTAIGSALAKNADILHLATHAVADDSHPEFSGIYFSQVGRNGRSEDGFLNLYEIYGLHLPVEMVVLSACDTGQGRASGAEGVIGLKRAFEFAGAERVVVSLWAVDDEGTALFMREFYRSLFGAAALSPAEALRSARQAMWRQPRWRDPSYWAGFVLEGDWARLRAMGDEL